MKKTLLQTAHWLMEGDPDHRVVWLRRSSVPFASIGELTSANLLVIQHVTRDRARWGVIVDMRRAPARNDADFEQAMRALREAIATGFSHAGLLLATQAGVLQVQRLAREDGTSTFATTSEEAALAFARRSASEPRASQPAPSSRSGANR